MEVLGYTNKKSSKLGFFIKSCGVEDREIISKSFYLVGSEHNEVARNCLIGKNVIDIDQSMTYSEEKTWSKSDFYLEFLAFRFPSTGKLKAFCHIRMCLEDDCNSDSVQICT